MRESRNLVGATRRVSGPSSELYISTLSPQNHSRIHSFSSILQRLRLQLQPLQLTAHSSQLTAHYSSLLRHETHLRAYDEPRALLRHPFPLTPSLPFSPACPLRGRRNALVGERPLPTPSPDIPCRRPSRYGYPSQCQLARSRFPSSLQTGHAQLAALAFDSPYHPCQTCGTLIETTPELYSYPPSSPSPSPSPLNPTTS